MRRYPSAPRTRDDADFQGGSDRVLYQVRLPAGAAGPFRVDVELLYQPIAFRWAQNLGRAEGPEIDRFLGYYASVPNTPVVLASATQQTP